MLIDFREKEREGEKHRSIALTRDQTLNLGMCPDWELNPQPSSLQDDTPTK